MATNTLATEPATARAPESQTAIPGWLYLVFFLSGISGLMYEVVWVRMLGRILGNTAYATSTVLAAFMAGLAVGSYFFGRFIDRSRRPLVWYAVLELGIGATAFLSLKLPEQLIPVYQAIHDTAGGSRTWLTVGQVVIALAVLLLPTALMGATLPTLSSFGVRRRQDFGKVVGTFYALNTLGAVLGVLLSGFVLIGEIGETNTIVAGALLNAAVALGVLLLGRGLTAPASPSDPDASANDRSRPKSGAISQYPNSVRGAVVLCFAVSGFAALALEVVWSRMLLLYLGNSIYAFSAMLAVVLAGMGVGSIVGARIVDRLRDPLGQLARLEVLIGLTGAAGLLLFPLPFFAALGKLGTHLLAPAVMVGPLGVLLGLAFPVAARCYTTTVGQTGRSVGKLYAWNTVGCIAGSLLSGFVMIPLLGASTSAVLLLGTSTLLGVLLLLVHPDGALNKARGLEWGLAAATVLGLVFVGDPYLRLIHRQMEQVYPNGLFVHRHIEDATATTTAFGTLSGENSKKNLWINGIGMTSLTPVTKQMAHLPIMLANDPKDVLVICFGMGTSIRSASHHEGLNVTAVELVPGVLDCYGYFHPDGPELLQRPNIRAVVDDGRNFLLVRPQQYDVITIDPAPPLNSAGTVNLYSREFFQLCRRRLRPGGVMCLWIPPERQSEIKMIMQTYLDVFDHVKVWSGVGSYPGLLMLGSHQPLQDIPEKIRKGYDKAAVVADLTEWSMELDQPQKLLDLYLTDKAGLREFLAGVPVITDDRPYTEFPMWRARFQPGEYNQELTGVKLRQYLKGPLSRK